MNQGSNPPSGHSGGKGRRRRRGRRGAVAHGAAPSTTGSESQGSSGRATRARARTGTAASPVVARVLAERTRWLAASTPRPWITVTVRCRATTTAMPAQARTRRRMGQGTGKQFIQPDVEPLPANVRRCAGAHLCLCRRPVLPGQNPGDGAQDEREGRVRQNRQRASGEDGTERRRQAVAHHLRPEQRWRQAADHDSQAQGEAEEGAPTSSASSLTCRAI